MPPKRNIPVHKDPQMVKILKESRTARALRRTIDQLSEQQMVDELDKLRLNKTGDREALADRIVRFGLRCADPQLGAPWFPISDEIEGVEPIGLTHEYSKLFQTKMHEAALRRKKERIRDRKAGTQKGGDDEVLGDKVSTDSESEQEKDQSPIDENNDNDLEVIQQINGGEILDNPSNMLMSKTSGLPNTQLTMSKELHTVLRNSRVINHSFTRTVLTGDITQPSTSTATQTLPLRPRSKSKIDVPQLDFDKIFEESDSEHSSVSAISEGEIDKENLNNTVLAQFLQYTADKEANSSTPEVDKNKKLKIKSTRQSLKFQDASEAPGHVSRKSLTTTSREEKSRAAIRDRESRDSHREHKSRTSPKEKSVNKTNRDTKSVDRSNKKAPPPQSSESESDETSSSDEYSDDDNSRQNGDETPNENSRDSSSGRSRGPSPIRDRKSKHRKGSSDKKSRPQRKLNPVKTLQEWSLKFDGKREKAERFLKRLRDCYKYSKLTDEQLLEALPCIFIEEASDWLDSVIDSLVVWDQFEKEFRAQYIKRIREEDLYDDLRARTQAKGESISNFITSIRLIIKNFSNPPPLTKQLKIAKRNLLPEYRQYMRGKKIYDFERLRHYGSKFEDDEDLNSRYTPPPPKEKMNVPRAAFTGITMKHPKVHAAAQKDESSSESEAENKKKRSKSKKPPQKGKKKSSKKEKVAATATKTSSKPPKAPAVENAVEETSECAAFQQQNSRPPNAQGTKYAQPQFSFGGQQAHPPPGPQRPRVDGEFHGNCNLCKDVGHKASFCPLATCYKCRERGHMANVCPHRAANNYNVQKCQSCDFPNVTVLTCPNCSHLFNQLKNGEAGGATHPSPPANLS